MAVQRPLYHIGRRQTGRLSEEECSMHYSEEEKRGRRLLLALLGLNLLLALAGPAYSLLVYGAAQIGTVLAGLLVLQLPFLVILWSIWRGSWPGLALVCISVVVGVGELVGVLQFGGMAAMNSAVMLQMVTLLARGTLLLAVFQHYEVGCWWSVCQARRRRRDLVIEVVLFILAVLVSHGVGLLV